jgi:hypothetical protein
MQTKTIDEYIFLKREIQHMPVMIYSISTKK